MTRRDLPWLLPSPSLNGTTANLLYAGMCIFEGVRTVSEGRGTSKPFELIGAPWMDGRELAARMTARGLPGVDFAPVYFKPASSKHAGQVCQGVQVLVRTVRLMHPSVRPSSCWIPSAKCTPSRLSGRTNSAGHDVLQPPSQPLFTRYLDKLLADADYTSGVVDGEGLIAKHAAARENYTRRKAKYHLYD